MEQERQCVSSLFSPPAAVHQGACAVVFHTAFAEAIRVVLALRCLARPGLAELGDALQSCRPSLSDTWDAGAPRRAAEPPFADAHHFTLASSSALPLASAQATLECASLHGLLTAAHLLRCSSWTAVSLVSIASPVARIHQVQQPYSLLTTSAASQPPLSLLQDARVVEELRTREGGWCATALVAFTEWLLSWVRSCVSASVDAALPSHALSVVEHDAPTAAALRSSSVNVCDTYVEDEVSSWPLPSSRLLLTRSRRVVVADPLPLLFPALAHRRISSGSVSDAASPSVAVRQGLRCGCGHRWFHEDLPRRCIQVALEEQATLWSCEARLRHAFVQWRARRGMRVVARLSRAAEVMILNRSRDGAVTGEAPAMALEAAPNATLATAATRAGSHAPHAHPLLASTDSRGVPSSECGSRGISAADVSAIVSEGAPPPSVQSQELLRIRIPAESATSPLTVPQLDTVLGGGTPRAEKVPVPATVSSTREESARDLELQDPPSAHPTAARQTRPSAIAEDDVVAPKRTSSLGSDFRTPMLQRLPAALEPTVSSNAAGTRRDERLHQQKQRREEDEVGLLQDRRNAATLRSAFLWWRDRRLYEALAVRFLQTQRREARLARCWAAWKRRRAIALQREKEARDVARSDVFTEEKALQYFRGLLQRWHTAALVRRFQVATVGHRVLRIWACQARLAQVQRAGMTLQQQQEQPQRPELHHAPQSIGRKRVLVQAWAQWRARYSASVADRHCARSCAVTTLRRMRAVRSEQQAYREAGTHHRVVVLGQVLRQWMRQRHLHVQVETFASSRSSQGTLLRPAWRTWRTRLDNRRLQRDDAESVRTFRVTHLVGGCLACWQQRWRAEVQLRGVVGRQQRRFLLRLVVTRWQQRTSIRLVVRHSQVELASKLQEQLQERCVLRTWRRRAAEYAGRRRQARATQIADEAEQLLRLNRLARTFYHWRTRELLLRRYNVDRRRLRPSAGICSGAASTCERKQLGGDTETALASSLAEGVPHPLPPPPPAGLVPASSRDPRGSSSSSRTSPSRSRRRRRHSPRVSPAHQRHTPSVATAAAAAARSTRLVPVAQADKPLRHRRLEQMRQLLLVAVHEPTPAATFTQTRVSLLNLRAASKDLTAAAPAPVPSTCMPLPHPKRAVSRTQAQPPRYPPYESSRGAPRPSPGRSHMEDGVDVAESPRLWRSRTATPLFTPYAPTSPVASPQRMSTTAQLPGGAALVDSPRPPSPVLRPRSTASLFGGATSLGLSSDPAPAPSAAAGRLLGQMELLLGRIRTMEKSYRVPTATAVAASSRQRV